MTDNRKHGYVAVSLKSEAADELRLLAADLTGILRRRVTVSEAVLIASEVVSNGGHDGIKEAVKGLNF
jgi:hypothetical protein